MQVELEGQGVNLRGRLAITRAHFLMMTKPWAMLRNKQEVINPALHSDRFGAEV